MLQSRTRSGRVFDAFYAPIDNSPLVHTASRWEDERFLTGADDAEGTSSPSRPTSPLTPLSSEDEFEPDAEVPKPAPALHDYAAVADFADSDRCSTRPAPASGEPQSCVTEFPEVFSSGCSLFGLKGPYLSRSRAQNSHLELFDEDFGAFDRLQMHNQAASDSLTSSLKTKHPAQPSLSQEGRLAPPRFAAHFVSFLGREDHILLDEPQKPFTALASVEGKRKRKRGSGSNGGSHGKRARGGTALKKSKGSTLSARSARLQKRSYSTGDVTQSAYSVKRDASVTTTGWHGVNPPKLAHAQLVEQWESGSIKKLLEAFHPIGYSRYAIFFY